MSEKPNYDKDGSFDDPVVRCCDCNKLVYKAQIRKFGKCPGCGNRRVRNVQVLSPEEIAGLKFRKVDPRFLKLFEEVDDEN
jgi:phage FluMu protein Com